MIFILHGNIGFLVLAYAGGGYLFLTNYFLGDTNLRGLYTCSNFESRQQCMKAADACTGVVGYSTYNVNTSYTPTYPCISIGTASILNSIYTRHGAIDGNLCRFTSATVYRLTQSNDST
ncbi:hypothetical protein BDV12DRAFT_120902 [Aspergillus spectabilis]